MDRFRYLVGVVTLVAALAGGVYLFNLLGDEDTTGYFRVNIEFRNVEGLLPGADVKYRGVVVGSVQAVTLRDDGKKGIAAVVLNPGKETLARTSSRFWIVTPRFGGLTAGATGLDTLVRNAYLTFFTPEPWGAQLANGSSAMGQDVPFVDPHEAGLPPTARGDLSMVLRAPENYGLVVGSPVEFRGIRTGEVRAISLAEDGGHVRMVLRIDRAQRGTVTDKSRFWVARPRLSGALLRGIDLQDIAALISPHVSYYTDPGQGLPVADGFEVAAEPTRPDFQLEKVQLAQPAPAPAPPPQPEEVGLHLVRVVYEAEEEDWLSPNDVIRREGTGVLWEDREGRPLVLTARSACDAGYFDADVLGGAPDIIREGVSVMLADGTVHRALRTWVAAEGRDLALLVVEVDPELREGIPSTPAAMFDFDFDPQGSRPADLELRAVGNDRRTVELTNPGGGPMPIEPNRGAVGLSNGRIVGLLVRSPADAALAEVEPVGAVPEVLRPVQ